MPTAPGEKRSELLDTDQLQVVMRSLGLQPPSDKDWRQFVKEHEFKYITDFKTGKICFEDFLFIIEKKTQDRYTRQQIMAAFEVFDEDKTGAIKTADLKHMMISLGNELTESEINEMCMEADIDGSGKIEYAHFIDVIMSQ